MLNWCLYNKFELVELERTGDSDSDTEGNKYGIERIIEALHAHTWPNIVLKSCVLISIYSYKSAYISLIFSLSIMSLCIPRCYR